MNLDDEKLLKELRAKGIDAAIKLLISGQLKTTLTIRELLDLLSKKQKQAQ